MCAKECDKSKKKLIPDNQQMFQPLAYKSTRSRYSIEQMEMSKWRRKDNRDWKIKEIVDN